MRKTITIMIWAIATQIVMAHNGSSVLNIRLNDNSPFAVFVDGQRIGGIANRACIPNLSDGKHFLEVYRMNTYRGRGRKVNGFKDMVRIECNTESFATIDIDCNKLRFDKVIPLNNYKWDDRRDRDRHGRPNHQCEGNTDPCGTTAAPLPMSQNDFAQLKQTIDNGSFESTKLNIFKQALPYNYFTTAQVRELMNLFWFENTKLQIAKLAYPRTLDQNNYYTLNNEFSFSSSVNELGEFIAMK